MHAINISLTIINRQCRIKNLIPSFGRFEVIGAMCAIEHDNSWGLSAFRIGIPKLTKQEILHFLCYELPARLTPFPGPRSIVILDNMPSPEA